MNFMIKVTDSVPKDIIRQGFLNNSLVVDSSKATPAVKEELDRYMKELETEMQKQTRRQNEYGAQLRMQNNKTGKRSETHQRLRVQQRVQSSVR